MSPTAGNIPFDNPLDLVAGFDPGCLPDAGSPVAGARSWRWLADPELPEEERREYLRQYVRGFGTTDPTDRDLQFQPRSREEVIDGHLRQQVYVDLPDGTAVLLQPVAPEAAAAAEGGAAASDGTSDGHGAGTTECAFPFPGPVAIIGTTVPTSSTAETAGVDVAADLHEFLAGRGIECWSGVAADPGREWVDPVVLASAADADAVRLAAQSHWQPFLTLWRPDGDHAMGTLDVVSTDAPQLVSVGANATAALRRITQRPCPLIPGAEPGDLCWMHGGGYVSRSITAAGRWQRRRARMIRALGCDTCGGGAIKIFQNRVIGQRPEDVQNGPGDPAPTRHDRLVGVESPDGR